MSLMIVIPPTWAGLVSEVREVVTTPYGPVTLQITGPLAWVRAMPGDDPRATIVAAQTWGGGGLVILAPAVALSRLLRQGDWVVPDDYVDLTRGGPTTFFEREGRGYISQVPAFAPELREALVQALAAVVGPRHFDAGVLVGYTGPRAPTPAEARAWRLLGGDVAAPIALPMAYLARERNLPAAVLAFVSALAPRRPDAILPPPAVPEWTTTTTLLTHALNTLTT